MTCLGLTIIILLSKSVFSQLPRADKQAPIAPICGRNTPVAACCPLEDEFPLGCIPFDSNDPLCSDRKSWWCCFQLESGYSFPGREEYPNHGIGCRKAVIYVWRTEKEWCPIPGPGPAISNPFQQLEDFMNGKQQKRSVSGDGEADCQNSSPNSDPNLDSLVPSPEFSDLSSTSDEHSNGDAGLFLNDPDEHNNKAAIYDDTDSISMFLPQNEIGPDDLISSNVEYDNFQGLGNAIGGVGGNSGQSITGDDIAMFTDQDMFTNTI